MPGRSLAQDRSARLCVWMAMNKQQLPIKNPCTQDWNSMEGSERQRFCGVCDKSVHNLLAMTKREAQAVLKRRRQGQRLCVRYSAGDDGEILFQRQSLIPAGLLLRTRQVALQATLAAAVITAAVELPGCVPAGPISGAITARAAADEVAEQLAEAGACSISLEPLLPLTLQLHAVACKSPIKEALQEPAPGIPQPIEEVMGQVVTLPQNLPLIPPAKPVAVPTSTQEDPPHVASKAKKAATKPSISRRPEHLMGDVM